MADPSARSVDEKEAPHGYPNADQSDDAHGHIYGLSNDTDVVGVNGQSEPVLSKYPN